MEVFMEDFSGFGTSFTHYLHNLNIMLEICKARNQVSNWEKCNFMVHEGIVLGRQVSKEGLEVDKAKILLLKIMYHL